MNKKKALLAFAILALVALFFLLGLDSYFDLAYFQEQRAALQDFTARHFALSSLIYFSLYVAVTALSLPAAAVLTVIGGAVFGLAWGIVLVSFASSIGATLAFLAARLVLRDWVQRRFGASLKKVNRGVERDGAFYLFSLRLVPLFPFVLVNLVMALTPLRTLTFYLVSQLGMLPGTALYVNLGAQLGAATGIPDILGADVLLSLLAVALFPWLARAAVARWRRRRIYRGFARPRKYDANLVVIGAGSAGLVTAYIAALLKARVILVEKGRMGGDCLNTGCVPSKALIRSAAVRHLTGRAGEFGLAGARAEVDFPRVMARVRKVIEDIEPHDSKERYTKLGVECVEGEARIASPFSVEVNGREIRTRAIVLATGAAPLVPPIPGLDETGYLTSETVWDLEELPRRFLVLGGGAVGCELAQAFARLGSEVTLVDQAPRILPGEDEDVSAQVSGAFETEGIRLLNACQVIRLWRADGGCRAQLETGGGELEVEFDRILLAVGRKARVAGFGLEELGVPLNREGALEVNDWLETHYPNIYACGDVAGPYRFTHMAAFQAWYASINSLFGMLRKFRVDYSVVPWGIFTDPEVARVGLNEREAKEKGIAFELSFFGMADLDRAIAEGEAKGFVKVLTTPGRDRILGAVITGPHAAELIGEFVLAMTHKLGLKKILSTIHVYPTLLESNKYAAGEWRRRHAPEWLYPWLERFHRRRRGE